jgi:hypothetical protein
MALAMDGVSRAGADAFDHACRRGLSEGEPAPHRIRASSCAFFHLPVPKWPVKKRTPRPCA